jgi:hypothetical protein
VDTDTQKIERVDVWWVQEFKTWAVTMYDAEGNSMPQDNGEECEYHHRKHDAVRSASLICEQHAVNLSVYTKNGTFN